MFPDAILGEDYVVRDSLDGNGQYIAEWNLVDPEPTRAEMLVVWDTVELDNARNLKLQEIKDEGLSRIQGVFPAIADFCTLQLIKDIMLSVAPSARQLTIGIQKVSDTYQAGADAMTAVEGLATVNLVNAFNPIDDVSWP